MQRTSKLPRWLAALPSSRGYIPALIAISSATAVHFLLRSTVGITGAGVFFLYLLAVLYSSWCGYGPGLLALALAVGVIPFGYRPNFSLRQVDPGGLIVLTVLCCITSWMGHFRRRTETQLREDNEVLDARVRAATADLQHRVAELETLYSQLSIGLCYVDQQSKIVRINRTLATMTGALMPEAANGPLAGSFNPALAGAIGELIAEVRRTGESVLNFEMEDQDQVWLVGCSPVRLEGERLAGFQVMVQDITDRKRNEQALQKANSDLRRANEDLSQFTYIAAHDLQEPLRNVVLFSELVHEDAREVLDEKTADHLDFIAENARRMSQLITDVVTYSFVSTMSVRQVTEVDLNEVCKFAIGRIGAELKRAGAQVTLTDLPQVSGDKDQLTQVFAQLLSNAVKFRRPDLEPRITISAALEPGDGSWKITVQDNGQGFTKEYRESVFGILKRLHGRDVPGSGIGLAICKAVVEGHGGRIWVESAEGEGTTVHLTLTPHAVGPERRIA
jgi:PAS domain S-box-containing protein